MVAWSEAWIDFNRACYIGFEVYLDLKPMSYDLALATHF